MELFIPPIDIRDLTPVLPPRPNLACLNESRRRFDSKHDDASECENVIKILTPLFDHDSLDTSHDSCDSTEFTAC